MQLNLLATIPKRVTAATAPQENGSMATATNESMYGGQKGVDALQSILMKGRGSE